MFRLFVVSMAYLVLFGFTVFHKSLAQAPTAARLLQAVKTGNYSALLFQAAATGNRQTVEQLLEAGANPMIKNAAGLFPFHLAAQNKHPALAGILLKAMRGVDGTDDKSWTPMQWAVLARDQEMLTALLREKANFRYRMTLPTREYQDPYDVAKLINTEDQFLTVIFAEQRHDIVETLVFKAARDGDVTLIKLLAKHGLDLKSDLVVSQSAVSLAAKYGREDFVRYLFEQRLVHEEGTKGLLVKARIYQDSMLEVLLDYIKDPDEVNRGYTAVYKEVRTLRSRDKSSIFLGAGADPVHAADDKGSTPLHIIVKRENDGWMEKGTLQDQSKDIEEVLNHGVDVNAVNAQGESALIILAKAGLSYVSQNATYRHHLRRLELMKLLLKHSADPSIKDNDGLTARDYAKQNISDSEEAAALVKLLE